ncbi:hypothetical protein RHECIAT_CH0003761 [Rhizobium etli CIAT 652]|uniref:Uncharacterized protein n=1 Tax=Rhizobium etli (strain CIAT 652) TaxID=491916 RepID=B3PZ35_RHIE6|nr:hypothetical protein RHECIAT_CH0003761 [Rhizobium etli CIAT 652]
MIAIDHLRHVNVESARTASVRCRAVDPGSHATLLAPGRPAQGFAALPHLACLLPSPHAPGHMFV